MQYTVYMATLTENIIALHAKGKTVKEITDALHTVDKPVLRSTVANIVQRLKKRANPVEYKDERKERNKEILIQSTKKAVENFVETDNELNEYIAKSSRKTGMIAVGILQQVAEQLDCKNELPKNEIATLYVKLKFLEVANNMFKQKD
jgi:hypothetical protein